MERFSWTSHASAHANNANVVSRFVDPIFRCFGRVRKQPALLAVLLATKRKPAGGGRRIAIGEALLRGGCGGPRRPLPSRD
jgi:hypothetical protein